MKACKAHCLCCGLSELTDTQLCRSKRLTGKLRTTVRHMIHAVTSPWQRPAPWVTVFRLNQVICLGPNPDIVLSLPSYQQCCLDSLLGCVTHFQLQLPQRKTLLWYRELLQWMTERSYLSQTAMRTDWCENVSPGKHQSITDATNGLHYGMFTLGWAIRPSIPWGINLF